MREPRRFPYPLLILAGAAGVIILLRLLSNAPEERPRVNTAPLVRTLEARASSYRFTVRSQGEVAPRRESDLVPQVTGEIVWVSPALAAGGFFGEGDVLARIDPADYRVNRESARAAVAKAKSEFGRATKDRDRQRRLADQSVASQSRIDDAENAFAVAEANLRAARASLEQAERDLARTELTAPFRGRVRSEQADVGQFVTRGTAIGRIFAVDFAEIRLPLPDRELAYLDLSLIPTGAQSGEDDSASSVSAARVFLEAEFAGARHRWEGRLVRTEAELDPRSRMVHAVARVADPYGLETERSAPLPVGLFVEATIEGRTVENAFVLPRSVLRDDERVYVIDANNNLRFREVEILRTEREEVVLGAGLKNGDRVCTSPMQAAIEGMAVRIADPAGDPKPTATATAEPKPPRTTPADAGSDAPADLAEIPADLQTDTEQVQ